MKYTWSLVALTFLILALLQGSFAYLWKQHPIPENRTEVLEQWLQMDKGVKDTTKSLIKSLMPMVMGASGDVKLSQQCVRQTLLVISGIRNLKKWAIQFLDSSAKMVDGVLAGTFSFLGVYEECMDTVVLHPKVAHEVLFRGQYCTIEARPPLSHKNRRYRLFDKVEALSNFTGSDLFEFLSKKAHIYYFLPYKFGICIPSGCSMDDINEIMSYASKKLLLDVEATHCEIKEQTELSPVHISAIAITCILGAFVLLGTTLEIHSNRKNDPYKKAFCRVLICFSLITNFKRLMSTQSSVDNLRCLHGLRFLSIMWVVAGHCYMFSTWFIRSYRNLFYVQRMEAQPVAQILTNGSEAIDSFIFMSGLLVSYLTLKHVFVDNNNFDLKYFIFRRLWRIVPVYYFIILFSMLAPLMGSGPLFYETMQESVFPCYKYWWRHFLFINNFYYQSDSCWIHTWYVACDMQLYILSLLVILPMLKSKLIGLTINMFLIIASIVYNFTITYLTDTPSVPIILYPDPEDRALGHWFTYSNSLSRAGPYFIGMFVGYILVMKPSVKIPKTIQVIGWCLSILSCSLVILGTSFWFLGKGPDPLDNLMYATFYKAVFGGGIGWVVFCCITGHADLINALLSWKVWMPLGKLCFLIYLIQPIFQTLYIANFQSTQEFTHLHAIVQFFGFLCISTLLAMVCNLLVESPFLTMEKLMLPAPKDQKELVGETNYATSGEDMHESDEKKDVGKFANGTSLYIEQDSKL